MAELKEKEEDSTALKALEKRKQKDNDAAESCEAVASEVEAYSVPLGKHNSEGAFPEVRVKVDRNCCRRTGRHLSSAVDVEPAATSTPEKNLSLEFVKC